jgi:hypothetical protein
VGGERKSVLANKEMERKWNLFALPCVAPRSTRGAFNPSTAATTPPHPHHAAVGGDHRHNP